MTISSDTAHLAYDELLQALVHVDDLSAAQVDHLERCDICRTELNRLSRRYKTIGRMAAQLAPDPTRRFRLPLADKVTAKGRYKHLWAAGLVVAAIALFSLYTPRFKAVDTQVQQTAGPQLSDLALTLVVDALVENALPPAFRELAAVADPPDHVDVIDWVVPPVEDEDDIL